MRKLVLTAALLLPLVLISERASAQGIPLTFGAHGIYDLDVEELGIGGQLRAGVELGGFALLLNPSLEYFFVDNANLFRVGADLLYQIGTQNVQVFQPYVGAGLGIQRFSLDIDDEVGVDVDDTETDLGLNLLAGVNFGVGSPVVPFAQAGLLIADESFVALKVGILFGGQ